MRTLHITVVPPRKFHDMSSNFVILSPQSDRASPFWQLALVGDTLLIPVRQSASSCISLCALSEFRTQKSVGIYFIGILRRSLEYFTYTKTISIIVKENLAVPGGDLRPSSGF